MSASLLSGELYQKLVAGDSFNIASVLNDQTNRMIERMYIECNTAGGGGGITIQMPTVSYLQGTLNFEVIISDTGNNAGTNNITILPGNGNTINQAASFVINTNKGGVWVTGGTQTDWVCLRNYSVTGSGTVSSFSSGNLSPLFTTSVATATTTPALSFTLSSHEINTVFAGPPSGAAGAPTFRSLVQADFYRRATATLDFPSTNAGFSSELTIPLSGAVVGDPVILGIPSAQPADCCFTAYVSATNVVTVRFNNYSQVAPIDPASGSYTVAVLFN